LLREVMPKKNCLNELTLAQMHQEIYHSASLTAAAARLGVVNETLASHLGKFKHQGNPLTYAILRDISLANGADTFGERYQSLMVASRVELKKLTFREVHQVIQQSTSLVDAAARLGVHNSTLASHLGKFEHQGNVLTYKFLKGIPLAKGSDIFGERYESAMNASRVDLTKLTLRQVHEAVKDSISLLGAATRFGVLNATFACYLGRFLHQGNPLTYEFLKGISLENGADIFGERYELAMNASRVDIKKYTFKQVHEAIKQSTSLFDAAGRLGVIYSTLTGHLSKFMYKDNPLTYEFLKGISLEEGADIFGECYESAMNASRVDLTKLTLRQVHEAIQDSISLRGAATRFGVSNVTLAIHLGRFLYQGNPLTYETLKGISLEEGADILGQCYESPMRSSRVDLTTYTLSEVHEAIQKSTSLCNAAGRLGVQDSTFAAHLGRFKYQGNSLTYEFLKGVPLEKGSQNFGDCYESPMNVSRVDLKKCTLRQVHEAIKKSKSLSEAAGLLGVYDPTLGRHLGKFMYKDNPLTYEFLKGIPLENGSEIFGERYESLMEGSRVDLMLCTFSEIHKEFLTSKNISEAAYRLGVSVLMLVKHLLRCLPQLKDGDVFRYLNQLTEEEALRKYGLSYNLPIVQLWDHTINAMASPMEDLATVIDVEAMDSDSDDMHAMSSIENHKRKGLSFFTTSDKRLKGVPAPMVAQSGPSTPNAP